MVKDDERKEEDIYAGKEKTKAPTMYHAYATNHYQETFEDEENNEIHAPRTDEDNVKHDASI